MRFTLNFRLVLVLTGLLLAAAIIKLATVSYEIVLAESGVGAAIAVTITSGVMLVLAVLKVMSSLFDVAEARRSRQSR